MPAKEAEAVQREKIEINDIWKLVSLQVTNTNMDITIK